MSGHFFLIGLPGSGKTTLAKRVAKATNLPWLDLDHAIEAGGKTIEDLFATHGEAYFRALESHMLTGVLRALKGPTLIATGGGAPCYGTNLAHMHAAGTVIWLDPPLDILVQRLSKARNPRPLFMGMDAAAIRQKLADLYETRSPFYSQADHRLRAAHLPEAQAALEALVH